MQPELWMGEQAPGHQEEPREPGPVPWESLMTPVVATWVSSWEPAGNANIAIKLPAVNSLNVRALLNALCLLCKC